MVYIPIEKSYSQGLWLPYWARFKEAKLILKYRNISSRVYDLLCIGSSKFVAVSKLLEQCFSNCGPCTTCIRSTWIGIKVHVLGVTQHSESESWNEGWNAHFLIGSYWFFFKLICRPCCTSTGVPTRRAFMVLSPTQSPICLVASWVLLLSRSSHFSIRISQSNQIKTKQNTASHRKSKLQILLSSVTADSKELDSKRTAFSLLCCISHHIL